MFPELFRIPIIDYPISPFGVMMALGFLAGYWFTARRMEERGYDRELASDLLLAAMLGGILGSKLYYTIDVGLRTGAPFSELLLARAGITWYGGLFGGMLASVVFCRVRNVPWRVASESAVVGLAVGQALGRIGCFLVGDDYGIPTDLPWGIAFPLGAPPIDVPVHPTQLYEVLWLLPVAAFLYWRRDRSPSLFGEYLALNGIGRIFIEKLRVNPDVALGMTEPQWIGIGLVVAGTATWLHYRHLDGVAAATDGEVETEPPSSKLNARSNAKSRPKQPKR